MKKYITYSLAAFVLITFNMHGQDKKASKAKEKFSSFNYADAITSYEELIANGYSSEEAYKNLGDSHYSNANYEEASNWYAKLVELSNANENSEYLYRYAQTLKSLKEYEKSDAWMKKFEQAKSMDLRAQKFVNKKDYLAEIKKNSGRYTIKNVPINSMESDFSPAFYKNELVFSSARDTGTFTKSVHLWNKKSFLNLYSTALTENDAYGEVKKLSKNVNKKAHESSPVFTKDGQTMYFTRNNFKNGSFSRDKEGVSRLKIYKASLKNDEWTAITELPFNSDQYSAAHPALNEEETKLYFSSNMPGTYGESDLFYVTINADGSYGIPVNLGNRVNTEARETFPFITQSDVLYFASDGHPGLGGLDIFGISLNELDNAKAVNLGESINSEEDDFSYIINEGTKKGFFASNRTGGQGSDDIYSFTEIAALDFSCATTISGVVRDQKTNEMLPNAKLVIQNAQGELITESMTDAQGNFSFESDCEKGAYSIIASKENYDETTFEFVNKDGSDMNDLEIVLDKPEEATIGEDLAKKLNLEKIYFDFDKSNIRKDAQVILAKVVVYLNEYQNAKIKIGSHTDARGNDAYNLALSQRRANATMQYLISQGIDASRLSAEGYGETKLVNECANGTSCSSENHQLNRRSEFIVVK